MMTTEQVFFTHEIEEQTCYGTHFTQNNGGGRFKLPFEKVYQPYNGPTIRKFAIFLYFLVTKLGKPCKKSYNLN